MRATTLLSRFALVATGLAVLVGCQSPGAGTEGGGPLPHQFDGETYPGSRFEATGDVVQAENGCLYVTVDGVRRYAVWPRDAAQDPDDASQVLLANGSRVAPGDRVSVTAVVYPVSDLPGVPDGYWGNYTGYCAPEEQDVIVLDRVEVTG